MLRCIARDARSAACSAEADIVSMAERLCAPATSHGTASTKRQTPLESFREYFEAGAIRVKRTVRHSPLGCVAPYPPTLGPRLWQSSTCLTCQHAAEQRTSRCRLALTVSRTPCVDCRARHPLCAPSCVTLLRGRHRVGPRVLLPTLRYCSTSPRGCAPCSHGELSGVFLTLFGAPNEKGVGPSNPLSSATPMLASAFRRKPEECPDRLRERSPLWLRQLSIEADHRPALLIAGHDGHPLPFVLNHML